MPDNITQEVLTRVDALAAKLGTSVEFLYTVLIADVALKGLVVFVCMASIGLLVGLVGYLTGRSLFKKAKDERSVDAEIGGYVVTGLGIVVGFGLIGGSVAWLCDYAAPNIEVMRILSDLF